MDRARTAGASGQGHADRGLRSLRRDAAPDRRLGLVHPQHLRRHAPARTSSSRPARMSLLTTFRATSPLTFAGSSTPRSSRCEAADRMMSCVSVSLAIGILRWVAAASFAATTTAPPRPCSRRGRIPRRASCPERSHYRSVHGRMPVLSG